MRTDVERDVGIWVGGLGLVHSSGWKVLQQFNDVALGLSAVHSITYPLLEQRAIPGVVMFGASASIVVVTQLSGDRRRRTSRTRCGTT